MDCKSGAKMSS